MLRPGAALVGLAGPDAKTANDGAVVDWRDQVAQLAPADERERSALERVDTVLAGETVADWVMVVRRDVCDEGHLHADVTVWLLTGSRLLAVEVNDAHHLHGPDTLDGTALHTVQVALSAVQDVAVHSWLGEGGEPVAMMTVAHRGGRLAGRITPHQCDDPECEEAGGFLLDAWDEGLELSTEGAADADAVLRFAGVLGRAVASGG